MRAAVPFPPARIRFTIAGETLLFFIVRGVFMYDNVVRNGNYTLHFLTEKQLSTSDLKIVLAKYMEKTI